MRALLTLTVATLVSAAGLAAADFDSCVDDIRVSATQQGVSRATFDRVMDGVTPDPTNGRTSRRAR